MCIRDREGRWLATLGGLRGARAANRAARITLSLPPGCPEGKRAWLESARFYWARCEMRSLTNVSHSSLFCVLPFIATSTQSPTTTTTGGRMQAEKHRSALRCKLEQQRQPGLSHVLPRPSGPSSCQCPCRPEARAPVVERDQGTHVGAGTAGSTTHGSTGKVLLCCVSQ